VPEQHQKGVQGSSNWRARSRYPTEGDGKNGGQNHRGDVFYRVGHGPPDKVKEGRGREPKDEGQKVTNAGVGFGGP